MFTKQGLLFFGLVCLQAALVRALPDWVPPEVIDMVQDDKQRCMEEHGTTEDIVYGAYVTQSGRPADKPPHTCTVGVELSRVRSASGSKVGERLNSEVGSTWARANDSGITASESELIQQVGAGNIPNDRAITCYMYCLLEAFSLVDEEANFESDMLMGLLPENLQDTAEKVLAKCTPGAGADNCEKMYSIAVCVQQAVPELWFIV